MEYVKVPKMRRQSAKGKLILMMAGILLAACVWYCLKMVAANQETSKGTLVERCACLDQDVL